MLRGLPCVACSASPVRRPDRRRKRTNARFISTRLCP